MRELSASSLQRQRPGEVPARVGLRLLLEAGMGSNRTPEPPRPRVRAARRLLRRRNHPGQERDPVLRPHRRNRSQQQHPRRHEPRQPRQRRPRRQAPPRRRRERQRRCQRSRRPRHHRLPNQRQLLPLRQRRHRPRSRLPPRPTFRLRRWFRRSHRRRHPQLPAQSPEAIQTGTAGPTRRRAATGRTHST